MKNNYSISRLSLLSGAAALSLFAGEPVLADTTGQNSGQETDNLFTRMQSDINVQLNTEDFPAVYANFCKLNPNIQSIIDYYVIANNEDKIYIQDIPKYTSLNDESYISDNPNMRYRSFPLLNWMYNSITWADEPMKFYYLVKGSWAVAPIYNITPDRNAKPTGRFVMPIAIGMNDRFLNIDTPFYQSDCKTDNFCEDNLNGMNPFRTILMITRDNDGYCTEYFFKPRRVDTEYALDSEVVRNEARLFAPHGNFRFELSQEKWESTDKKVKGSFTYKLSTLTIDGKTYKMIPGGNPFNKGSGYLKGEGPYKEKWYYMYQTGNIDHIYVDTENPKYHLGDKVVVTVFSRGNDANNSAGSTRFVLYPCRNIPYGTTRTCGYLYLKQLTKTINKYKY